MHFTRVKEESSKQSLDFLSANHRFVRILPTVARAVFFPL